MSENNFDIYIRRINLSLQKTVNISNFLGHNSKKICFASINVLLKISYYIAFGINFDKKVVYCTNKSAVL